MRQRLLVEVIYFLFQLLFAYAAIIKLMDLEKFQGQIGQSSLLTSYANFLSWSVPVIELCVVIVLSISKIRLIGMYGAVVIMATFTWYVFYILNFDPNIPCSCGGILDSMGWTEHLIFNASFLILAVVCVVLESTPRSVAI
ncbi:MauE/DoxX family redox-associated membrane protein [Pseudochryseolinea flava]|uniref:Methylamine utilisation protein MauE domain-containing protein n=1 Tax=Pseudochryseolinea flava TaxID=2059302 RepID=A0A364Y5R9_9BACT|nr:MauE/DoxX family redox-associated membrane protein [Pseudochryseolinea flava]RAW01575.1 hypothetical protein DQQ10_07910 [Pseudochryseolinea flava]